MRLKLYNTKTRLKEVFIPEDDSNIKMYVCGPTVYDRAHIGNARPVVVFDLLFRVLRHIYGSSSVVYVRNFTDIDDKINFKSSQTGKTIREITNETIDWYNKDMTYINALEPSFSPRATEYVAEMIDQILVLLKNGNAYVDNAGHVMFSVKSFTSYGLLSKMSRSDMISGSRVEILESKKDPIDFVLWKPSDDKTPGWDSPWGRGRPGWHIECSAMIKKILGKSLDIHGGGIDLVFPHHENELAQSACAYPNEKFANFWMHNGFLQVEGKKMSKSAGNYFTIRDLISAGICGDTIRFVLLSTHYRQPLDWTNSRVKEVEATINKWKKNIAGIKKSEDIDQHFLDAIFDDLNTPKGITELHRLASDGKWPQLLACAKLLGFSFKDSLKIGTQDYLKHSNTKFIKQLLNERVTAREQKNYEKADQIRNSLIDAGINIEDTENGVKWELTSTFDEKKLEALR